MLTGWSFARRPPRFSRRNAFYRLRGRGGIQQASSRPRKLPASNSSMRAPKADGDKEPCLLIAPDARALRERLRSLPGGGKSPVTGHDMENRHGPACSSTAPPSVAFEDAENSGEGHRITTGDDKPYDTSDHAANLRALNVTPHVTQNNGINKNWQESHGAHDDGPRALNTMACRKSRRPMIECIFGWGKQHGTMRKNIASFAALQPISCST